MKRMLLFTIISALFISLNAQTSHTIVADEFSFIPANLTVNQGDTVFFNVGFEHPVLQVSEATWTENGNTALPGGISFASGTGTYIANTTETVYYICEFHIGAGMKGAIFVNATTSIEKNVQDKIRIFPSHASDHLNVINTSNNPLKEIKIMDLSGRTILSLNNFISSEKELRIDVNQLNKGIYFINIDTGNVKVSRKFMKL